jgi:hypothetical protein
MPAGASWHWAEVYGLAEADASAVHGSWAEAVVAGADAVARAGAAAVLER